MLNLTGVKEKKEKKVRDKVAKVVQVPFPPNFRGREELAPGVYFVSSGGKLSCYSHATIEIDLLQPNMLGQYSEFDWSPATSLLSFEADETCLESVLDVKNKLRWTSYYDDVLTALKEAAIPDETFSSFKVKYSDPTSILERMAGKQLCPRWILGAVGMKHDYLTPDAGNVPPLYSPVLLPEPRKVAWFTFRPDEKSSKSGSRLPAKLPNKEDVLSWLKAFGKTELTAAPSLCAEKYRAWLMKKSAEAEERRASVAWTVSNEAKVAALQRVLTTSDVADIHAAFDRAVTEISVILARIDEKAVIALDPFTTAGSLSRSSSAMRYAQEEEKDRILTIAIQNIIDLREGKLKFRDVSTLEYSLIQLKANCVNFLDPNIAHRQRK